MYLIDPYVLLGLDSTIAFSGRLSLTSFQTRAILPDIPIYNHIHIYTYILSISISQSVPMCPHQYHYLYICIHFHMYISPYIVLHNTQHSCTYTFSFINI